MGDRGWSVFESAFVKLTDWTRELSQLQSFITGGRLQDKLLLDNMTVEEYYMEVDTFMAIKQKEKAEAEKFRTFGS